MAKIVDKIIHNGDEYDIKGGIISWASFWAFAAACADYWVRREVSIERAHLQYNDNPWTLSYTMKWFWWVTLTSESAHDNKVTFQINWVTVSEINESSWLVEHYDLTTPLTLSPWDIVTVTCTTGSGYWGKITAYISDFY